MPTTSRIRTTTSRVALAFVLVIASLSALPPRALAARVTSIVFNNVSASAALNTTPTSWTQVDDITVPTSTGATGTTLFLPASASPATLSGWVVLDDGTHEPFTPDDYTLTAAATPGDYTLAFARTDVTSPITVHQSAEVPAMYIHTGGGLAAIEADKDFEDTGGAMALVDKSAAATYNSALSEMKGRGNSTWEYPKKPYQIKVPTHTELVPGAGAHKTWILLANYLDKSLIRNEIAYNLEGAVNTAAGAPNYAIKGRMVDLFIDGGFRGSYFLTEKVQVGGTRVAITDLQKANEAANPDISTYSPTRTTSLPGAPGVREAGYVPFPNSPTGYEQSGYLLEMDFINRAREENSYVITRQGVAFVLKGPDDANADEITFIGNRLQKLEEAIYSSTGKNAEGTHFTELLDLNSWARYYLMQELLANDDGFKSSAYFHLDKGGLLQAGPMWDFDRSLGTMAATVPASELLVGKPSRLQPQWINQLLSHEAFRAAVKQAYQDIIAPEIATILSPGSGKLAAYAAEAERSAVLNKLRWPATTATTPVQDVAVVRTYFTQRNTAIGAIIGGNYVAGAMLPDGYYTLGNRTQTLDVKSSGFANGANVQTWAPNGTGAQTFWVERGDDGYYTVTSANSLKVVDVQGGSATDSTNVQQYVANGTQAQKWRIATFDGANYTVVSALGMHPLLPGHQGEDGYVLNVAAGATTSGTNVNILTANGSSAQRFRFTKVSLAPPLVTGGVYRIASSLNTGKVLDVAGASTANGANIRLWTSNGTRAQQFTASQLGNGFWELRTGTAPGRIVDVARSGQTNGTNVWQWSTNGTAAQQWTVRLSGDLNGSFYLVSRVNGLYLDAAGGKSVDGTNIWTYQPNGTRAQKYMLTKAG
ncbi:RICIN domain-containing protein [Propionibacteriaceae bacterium G57]|uniref:RICIN domain-containing protein n=1 Tax=Aestuariimicrobium sp. G57 TaxID=3418485 RepID=UPI003DA73307